MSLEFSISPSNKGDVYATEFVFKKQTLPTYALTTWDLGDGTFLYNKDEVSHIYTFPGAYTVRLSAWSETGDLETTFNLIDVDYVLRDAMIINQIPSKWGLPGLPSIEPFVVSLTSAKIEHPLGIVLQALNTKSIPHYAVPDKWNFLVPRWRFVDAETNEILDQVLPIKTTPIYKNGRIIAVQGQAAFYYIDDLATGTNPTESCPLLITATLSTEGFSYPQESLIYPYHSYSNSEVARAVIAWQINDVIPTELKITENFLNDIYPIKWTNVPIPVMITCRFDPSTIDTFSEASSVSATDVLSYPRTNDLGSRSPVDIKLVGLNEEEYTVNETPLYFRATDSNGIVDSGYVFTTVTPLVSSECVVVQVSTVAFNQVENELEFPYPDGFPVSPEVYISHPFQQNINKVNVVTYPANCESIQYFKDLGVLSDGSISFIGVPGLSSDSVDNFQLSGTSGVYGITYNPVKELIYAADADQDKIYVINVNKEIIQTLELSSVYAPSPYVPHYLFQTENGSDTVITENTTDELVFTDYFSFGADNVGVGPSTPSYISIDSKHNVWISLYDRFTLLKYDSTLQTLCAVAQPTITGSISALEEGSPLIAPPIVETDKNDDVWACYSHPLSSLLIKFDSNGNEVATAENLSFSSVPVSLAITKQNNVWVACRESNEVKCYGTNGNLLSSFEYLMPSYIAVDKQNNLWILHGYNFYSFLNTTTLATSSWKIETHPELKTDLVFDRYTAISNYSFKDLDIVTDTNEIWGGLSIDVYNRVWIIDSENNNVGVFSPLTPENIRLFDVKPTAEKNFILKAPSDDFVTEIPTTIVRSAQSSGDWSGNRWYQKYVGKFNMIPVSGVSVPFAVRPLENSIGVAKVNESFDCAAYFKSLALPEILNSNEAFFDDFLGAVVGTGDTFNEEIGRIVYEKIANFVSNHSDVDTAEINQLVSFAEQLSVPVKTFGINFPEEIKRLIDTFSVPKHTLRGLPNLDPNVENNIGTILTETDLISAEQYIFAKDKRYNVFSLVYVTPHETLGTVYPLQNLNVQGLRSPLSDNYYFFQYDYNNSNGYKANLIDWDSPNTTMLYTLSTDYEWYGDDQFVELYFNNLLTRRLFSE